MSKHWVPDENVVVFRQPRRPGGTALVLLGAVALGIGAGAVLHFSEAPQPPAPLAATETIVPETQADPADAEWAGKAEGEDSPSTQSGRAGVRLSFGSCKWGGGTNCVVDGDTFYIGGEKVRIAGIDAPETHDYRCDSELALGDRATERLQALLNSGAVTMTGIDRNRDTYGRLLRNVSVNGQDVGEALISAGVARVYAGGRRPWC